MNENSNQPSAPEWHLTETYKSLITLSIEALKILALINGGAAVAILAYLGNLASHAPAAAHLPAIKHALEWYCGGLVLTTFAFLVSYSIQLGLYRKETGPRRRGIVYPRLPVILWMFLTVFAALAFGAGCLSAANALIP